MTDADGCALETGASEDKVEEIMEDLDVEKGQTHAEGTNSSNPKLLLTIQPKLMLTNPI